MAPQYVHLHQLARLAGVPSLHAFIRITTCAATECCISDQHFPRGKSRAWYAGFAYLPKATETFLAQACEQGAKVHYNSEVQSLERGPSEHVASMPPQPKAVLH